MKQNKSSKCTNSVLRSCFVICLICIIAFTFVIYSFGDTINGSIYGNEFGSSETSFNVFSHDVTLTSNTGTADEEVTRIISSFDNAHITGGDNYTTLTTPDTVTVFQNFYKTSDSSSRTSKVQTMLLNETSIGNFLIQGELSIGGILLPYDSNLSTIVVNLASSFLEDAYISTLNVNVSYDYLWAHVQEADENNRLYALTIDSKGYTSDDDGNGNVTLMSTSVRNSLAVFADNSIPEGDESVYFTEVGTSNKYFLVEEIVLRYTIVGRTTSQSFSYDLSMVTDGFTSTPLQLQSDYHLSIAGVVEAFQYPSIESLGYAVLSPLNALFSTTIFFNVTVGSLFIVIIVLKLVKVGINFFAGG